MSGTDAKVGEDGSSCSSLSLQTKTNITLLEDKFHLANNPRCETTVISLITSWSFK